MAMTIPALTPLPAGYIAQLSDFTAMAYGCTFLMNKPILRIQTLTGGQALAASTWVAVNFDTSYIDPDGMWSAGTPSRATIQTPGFYAAMYGVNQAGATGNGELLVTTGPGNPAGSGITSSWFDSYVLGSATTTGGSGVIGQYLYAGDYVQVLFNGHTSSTVSVTTCGPYLGLEYVSI